LRKALLAGLLIGLLGVTWFAVTRPGAREVVINLPSDDGEADLLWHCTAPKGEADARARATTAHRAFQADLHDIAIRTAAAMQAAIAAADATGSAPDTLPDIDDAAHAEARALADRIGAETGCVLDEF